MRVLTGAEIAAVGEEALRNARATANEMTMGRVLLLDNFSPKLWAVIEQMQEDAKAQAYRDGYRDSLIANGHPDVLPEVLTANPNLTSIHPEDLATEHATVAAEEAPEAGDVKG